MALVDIRTGKGRKKFVEFVVVGDEDKGCKLGDIRWVWWDRSKSSPMLKVEWTDVERTHVKEIRLDADYARRGWRLLRDLYEQDESRSHHWEDWMAFCNEQINHPEAMVSEEMDEDGKVTRIAREFPDAYLPTVVQKMRAKAKIKAAERHEFVLPSDAVGSEYDDEPKKRGRPKKSDTVSGGLDPIAEAGGQLVGQ